jgi:apolipoprotein N-acyltransferase
MSRSFIGAVGMAIVAGALLALAFPGTGDQDWLAYGGLVPLLAAIRNVPWRRALFTPAIVAADVRSVAGSTLYVRYGDAFAWGAVTVSLITALVSIWSRRYRFRERSDWRAGRFATPRQQATLDDSPAHRGRL